MELLVQDSCPDFVRTKESKTALSSAALVRIACNSREFVPTELEKVFVFISAMKATNDSKGTSSKKTP